MRMVFGLVLILGLALAGFAVYMAKGYVGNYQAKLAAERAARAAIVPTVDVYVTNRQIKYGEPISKEDVRMVKWPENTIPEGAFLKEEDLFPNGERDLRTALRVMEKDEAVLAVKVTEPGEDAGITSRLSKGMRAFAIKVDATSGVSGFLRPGDKVDVYWSGQALDQEVTKLIETGLRLIAIDQKASQDLSGATIARTVTVEVTPQQVANLAQAQSTGRLSLSLRGANDDIAVGAVDVDQKRLLGIKTQTVVETAPEKVCTVKTRRGAEVVEMQVKCPTE